MSNQTQYTAPNGDKQPYTAPVLTQFGDLATLTKLSNGSGTGKIGTGADGSGRKT